MAKRKKNRRIKKTKYLSLLSLQFPGEKPLFKDHIPNNIIPIPTTTTTDHHQQLDLLLEKDGDDNMEYLLSASVDDDGGATTLTGLLLDSSSAADHVPVVVSSSDGADDELSPSAASVSYVSEAMNLVRTALRSRERDSSTHEERYVRYSEVVDDQRRRDHDEVSSRIAAVGGGGGDRNSSKKNEYHYQDPTSSMLMRRHRLSLKLDYQEIMNAWSDKGGFYVHSDFPQTVPDIIDDFFCHPPIPNGGGLWSVPEGTGGAMSMLKMEEEEEEEEVVVPQDEDRPHREEEEWEWKWKAAAGQREASVLRYKEKRRNRLFSKTIRYQVRKENAQKRPRVKGRFVKRN